MAALEKRPGSVLPAISRPWRLHLDFSCQVESNGWFSALKLIARISGPGHQLPVAVTSKFLVPGGIERLVFGDQVDRENFRTRPVAASHKPALKRTLKCGDPCDIGFRLRRRCQAGKLSRVWLGESQAR